MRKSTKISVLVWLSLIVGLITNNIIPVVTAAGCMFWEWAVLRREMKEESDAFVERIKAIMRGEDTTNQPQ